MEQQKKIINPRLIRILAIISLGLMLAGILFDIRQPTTTTVLSGIAFGIGFITLLVNRQPPK